jgi:hypothetical protein
VLQRGIGEKKIETGIVCDKTTMEEGWRTGTMRTSGERGRGGEEKEVLHGKRERVQEAKGRTRK